MEDMNAELWSGLPSEILEGTLSFLSVPVLCRFRTVCKRWNSLICNREFGDLCIQRARQRDACFLVACYNMNGGIARALDMNFGWSFLDLNERRWYTIKHEKTKAYDRCLYRDMCSVAMDGGLVCECFHENDDQVTLFVSNPIAKTSKRLPSYPFNPVTALSQMNMVVDKIAHNYKIFVMPYLEDEDDDDRLRTADNPFMLVYESSTNLWRTLANPPMPNITEVCFYAQCSVFYNGLLYILVSSGKEAGEYARGFWLWSYNHVEDTWTDIGMHICSELAYPQLLVSDNRLFLGSWLRKPSDTTQPHNDHASRLSYEVCEVNLEDGTCSTALLRMTGAVVAQLFHMPSKPLDRESLAPFALTACGLGEKIILIQFRKCYDIGMDSSGVCMVYDISTNSWDLLPKDPWSPISIREPYSWLDVGKPMNLILPASTLWERETEAGRSPSMSKSSNDMSLLHWKLCTW